MRLLYSWWSKQNKDGTLKEPFKKDGFLIDPIEMENNCELFSTAFNIAQQLTIFDYLVGDCVAVAYENQWFPGVIEVRVKVLYFLLCKQERFTKKLIKLPILS